MVDILLRFLAQDINPTIAAIEQGRHSPSLDVAFRMAHIFGKRVDEVSDWQADEQEAWPPEASQAGHPRSARGSAWHAAASSDPR